MKNIISILNKDLIQRLIYLIFLALITLLFWNKINYHPNDFSAYKLSFLQLYLLISSVLLIQIIRNNMIFWILTLGLFIYHIIGSFYLLINSIIDESEMAEHRKIEFKDLLIVLIIYAIMFMILWLIYKMKPKKLI